MARSRSSIVQAMQGRPMPSLNASPENIEVARSVRRGMARFGITPEQLEEESGGNDGIGGILGAGANVLGRTFDILSRPLYGVTNVIENIQNTGEFRPLGQLWQGLSGQDKVTGSDLLENAGVENGFIQGAGGLALDIALDPLTYVGIGLVKKPAEEAIQAIGARAMKEYTEQAAVRGTPAHLAKTIAEREARSKFLSEGIPMWRANPGAVSVGKQSVLDNAYEAAIKAQKLAREEERGRLTLKLLGNEVGGSESIYDVGSKIAKKTRETRVGRAVNRAFRPSATFIAGTNRRKRIAEAAGMSRLEADGKVINEGGRLFAGGTDFPGLKHLTDDEATDLTHAVENFDAPGLSRFDNELPSVRQAIRNIGLDERGTQIDEAADSVTNGQLIDNFVHHRFTGEDDPADVAFWNKRRKDDIKKVIDRADAEANDMTMAWAKEQAENGVDTSTDEFFALATAKKEEFFEQIPKKTEFTLKRAAEEGLHPVTDIRQVLGNHLQQHYKEVGRVKFLEGIVGEFGVDLGDGIGVASKARELGLAKVPTSAPPGSTFAAGKFLGENVYFPKEIVKAIQKFDQVFYTDEAAGAGLLSLYDQALSHLKFLQTVVNPGHHIRNAMSDITLNSMDGVVDPKVYGWSAMISRAQKNPLTDDLFESGDPLADAALSLDDIRIPVGNSELTGNQVERLFIDSGSKSGYYRTEITTGKGGVAKRLRAISEGREDWARRAHFIDALQKEAKNLPAPGSKNYITELHAAAERAGERVRKFNIDYGDLTPFEQRTMRRIVPFYTWMRKNIPLQIEGLLMRPGRQMVAPKIVRNLQVMAGQSPEDTDVLGLNTLPDYLRQAMAVNIAGEGEGSNGLYWNPNSFMPVYDLNEFFGSGSPEDIIERQLSGLTPFAQVPIQQITGHNFYTGRPQSKGILQNVLETTPMGRYSYGVTQGDSPWSTRLLNLVSGAGVTSLNEGMQRGELRRQEDIVQALLRERAPNGG